MHTDHPAPRFGTLAGLVAMLGVLVTLRVLTPLAGVKPLVESLADGILLVVPVDVFSWLKSTLGDQAKTWGYLSVSHSASCWSGQYLADGLQQIRTVCWFGCIKRPQDCSLLR